MATSSFWRNNYIGDCTDVFQLFDCVDMSELLILLKCVSYSIGLTCPSRLIVLMHFSYSVLDAGSFN